MTAQFEAFQDELNKIAGFGSWVKRKIEEAEAPPWYVSQVAQAAKIPEKDAAAYVRNIRPQRFLVHPDKFAKEVKPLWTIKEKKYNPLQQGLLKTAPNSKEEKAYLKKHQPAMDSYWSKWSTGQADLYRKVRSTDFDRG